jgi:hypothetical protein
MRFQLGWKMAAVVVVERSRPQGGRDHATHRLHAPIVSIAA